MNEQAIEAAVTIIGGVALAVVLAAALLSSRRKQERRRREHLARQKAHEQYRRIQDFMWQTSTPSSMQTPDGEAGWPV